MKRKHGNLRIENLEDRICPAPFNANGPYDVLTTGYVKTGGAKWFVRNNFPSIATGIKGYGIVTAYLLGPPQRTDAYDGAFAIVVNGTTFKDPTGIVDLTGTTVTSNPETLSGLTTTVQYFFDPNSPTVRGLYSFTNPGTSSITASVEFANNLGSDFLTEIDGTSAGGTTFAQSDRWFITSNGIIGGDPEVTWIRYGPGTVQTPESTPQIPGGNSANDLYIDQYELTVPAGQTRDLMFFGQLSQNIATAETSAATFNSDATVYSAGLLAGLTQQQESEIVNWQFPAITSADAATFHEVTNSSFTVTTTSPEPVTLSETGPLPSGVTFTDNGNGTGTIHGLPAFGTSGDYPITITASIGSGPATMQNFTLTVEPALVSHFEVDAPSGSTAGSPFDVTVKALNPFNQVDETYTGTVHFTSSDTGLGKVLPADYTFVTGDDGVHTFTDGVTLVTAGTETVTAADTVTPTIDGTADVDVTAAAATHLGVSAPTSVTAGSPFDVTVTALDPYGNTDDTYAGTVAITSSDGTATLPPDSMLSGGVGVFPVTLDTAGIQSLMAADTTDSLTGTTDTTVIAAAATHFTVSAPPNATAGTAFNVTITAFDQFGNLAANFDDIVHFTSTDGNATLPANSMLSDGEGTFSVTLGTVGTQTITATDASDASVTGTSGDISVIAGAATHFSISAPPDATAGTPFGFTVTALDKYDNTATSYTGTVHFTSTDGTATLPANSTLAGGTGSFTATLNTAGSETLSAMDTVNASIQGSTLVDVIAAAATHFSVSAPGSVTAGAAFSVTVTALDPYGNTDKNYDGTVEFTSSDGSATLPHDSTLTEGTGTFSATLDTAGSQTVIATDTVDDGITGSMGVTVIAAAATHFALSAPPDATAGTAFSFTVTAEDAFDNTATSYAGTLHFTSTDGLAALPANSKLTGGTGTFNATLDTAGNQTITGTDTVTSSIAGTSDPIDVTAAAATHLAVGTPATATAGSVFVFSVTALDQFGNTDTNYAGTVHFTSTDPAATLPANSPLAGGSGFFSSTLRTAGLETITATDTIQSSIAGHSNSIDVLAAAATHFKVTAPSSATAGAAISFSVTAEDAFGNTAAGYTGTVHFTSSDGAAALPANSTLTAGTGSFSATLDTAGSQTLTATDTASSSIVGTSNPIAVNAAAATRFAVSAPASTEVRLAFNFTVTAEDAFGNTATAYSGTVHFTSSDGSAALPANSTLAAGSGTFSATLPDSGTQTITATDTVIPSITGTSNGIFLTSAIAAYFVVSAPANATAGTAFSITVTAYDAANHVATGFNGSARFTTTSILSSLPGTVPLSGGTGTFTATLFTAGSRTITAIDAANSAITGTSSAIEVAIVGRYAVGSGPGVKPSVIVYSTATNAILFTLSPFESTFTGGIHVTTADVNGDGVEDIIVAAGFGGGPHVEIFNGKTGLQLPGTIGSFFAYSPNFRGGVNVAAGDINGDGYADIVAGAGPGGGPQVTVFNGTSGVVIKSFFAYDSGLRGGVSVAVGDVDGDGTPDIIAGAGVGSGPQVLVFSGKTGARIDNFYAFNQGFTGGVNVASGDVNSDGYADIVAGAGNAPQVNVFNGKDGSLLYDFSPYEQGFTGPVDVAVAAIGEDATPDIITGAGVGGGPHVKYYSGETGEVFSQDFPFDSNLRNGVFVGGD